MTSAPDAWLGPRSPDAGTPSRQPSFTSTTGSNSSYECKLDKKKWKPCESPKKLEGLERGKHTFEVRATDEAGNVDPSPAKDEFKVIDRSPGERASAEVPGASTGGLNLSESEVT